MNKPHFTSIGLALLVGLTLGIMVTTTMHVFADGDPSTDTVPRMIPYQGTLEMNGTPVNAIGGDAIPVSFAIYDGPDAETPVFTQQISIEVFAGRFTTTLGPTGDNGASITEIIDNADDLYLGMTLIGNILDPDDDIAMAGRQRILASPYAIWSTSATNFTIANTLGVGGSASVGGNLDVTGNVSANGSFQPSAGNAESRGINFPNNPGGGSNDGAWMRYFNESGEDSKLQIGISNDANDDIEFYQDEAAQMRIGDGSVQVNTNLNVSGRLNTGGVGLKRHDCRWKNLLPGLNDNTRHEGTCDDGEFMVGWGCYASDRLDGTCRLRCCKP